ncbi:hypothetical protein [Porphyromonas gingivicanis]|uniref:hypothetical protein n=1 Tax=Porphyromonas gingivicanis TaxID=266762 RepID=UPI00046E7F96|nr:hypothetical protein [Porphyromonas gingivicanis]
MTNRENTNLGFKELVLHFVEFLYAWLRRTLFQTAEGSVRLVRISILLFLALLIIPTLLMFVVLLLALTVAQVFDLSLLIAGWITALFFVVVLVLLYIFRKPLTAPITNRVLRFFMDCDNQLKRSMQRWSKNEPTTPIE